MLFNSPLFVWFGGAAFIMIALQIGVGTRMIKLPFQLHTNVIWVLLIILVLIHIALVVAYF